MCVSQTWNSLFYYFKKKGVKQGVAYNLAQKKGKYFLSMENKGEGVRNDRLDLDLTIDLVFQLQYQFKKTVPSLCHSWFFDHLTK